METKFKITVPKPCHEDWNTMTPNEIGRFCNSCAKSVVDFSGMKTEDIQAYFIKNQGQKVCGRFKTEQLDSIIIQIPRTVLFSQVQFHKIFLLALLISMPGLLIGQNANGNKQPIDKVEVVDSIIGTQTDGKDKLKQKALQENDSVRKIKIARMKELAKKREALKKDRGLLIMGKVAPVMTGDVAIETENTLQPQPKKEFCLISEIEKAPSFPGGISKFYEYFNSNFKAPEESKHITTKIFFSFIVNPDGSLSDIKLLRGVNDALNNEAMRVLKSSPKWIPGECKGEKVKVYYSIPIKITSQE